MKRYLVIASICAISLTSFGQAWTDLKDVPVKLTFPVVVALDGNIHLIGGGGPGGATDLHLQYKTASDEWDTLAPVPYKAQQPGGAAAGGKIYFFGGGFPNSGTPLDDHYVYDPITNTWDTAANIPANRVIHRSVAVGDSVYVMGGQPDKLRFERYAPSNNTWKSLGNLPDAHFWYGAILTVDDVIYRFGGGGFISPQDFAHKYDMANDNWVSLPAIPEPRHAIAAAAIGDSIYITGGYYGGEKDLVWIYDINSQTYDTGFSLPAVRNYHSMVSIGNCVYVVGGHDQTVDLSLIRHCSGDSADYTSISLPGRPDSELNISYGLNKIRVRTSQEKLESVDAVIYDLGGRMLQTESISLRSGQGEMILDEMQLIQGQMYICHIRTQGVNRTLKFIYL